MDETERRYRSKNENMKHDDFILQAMVMWNLYRLNQGWGRQKMLRQLTVWSNPKQKTESHLSNLWKEEIRDLQAAKKMGKTTLEHQDNFDTFCRFYTFTEDTSGRWARRSATHLNWLHILAEQATVQWALDAAKDDPHLSELAACVIRIQWQTRNRKQLPRLLLAEAFKSDGDEGYCKAVLKRMEQEAHFIQSDTPTPRKRRRVSND